MKKTEHEFIQKKIADDNKEIKHVVETVAPKEVKYFEVMYDTMETIGGNYTNLKTGDVFATSNILVSHLDKVKAWLVPDHLPMSGLNTIAENICKEISEKEYNSKK